MNFNSKKSHPILEPLAPGALLVTQKINIFECVGTNAARLGPI
jgi:hypothetical protein